MLSVGRSLSHTPTLALVRRSVGEGGYSHCPHHGHTHRISSGFRVNMRLTIPEGVSKHELIPVTMKKSPALYPVGSQITRTPMFLSGPVYVPSSSAEPPAATLSLHCC